MQNYSPGLEGVVVGTTEITYIDGKQGRLLYRGYDIHDLVDASFEEVVYLLWKGDLPDKSEVDDFRRKLAAERSLPPAIVDLVRSFPATTSSMECLRTALSALSSYDPEANEISPEAHEHKAMRLTAKMATLVAALGRNRRGLDIVAPLDDLDHAANFLYMLTGERAAETCVDAMNRVLVLHADHEMNASTFAARVTAATLSDMYSALTSAVGTLKGPLHGGANEAVMQVLLEIGTPDNAEPWIRDALEKKVRVPGFGHRIYKTEDPRSMHLRKIAASLSEREEEHRWYEITRVLEEYLNKERGLYANVDLYAASVLWLLGVPVDIMTPAFAMSRVAGWTAHIFEQYANNRLIRPEGEYVGPMRRKYVPLNNR